MKSLSHVWLLVTPWTAAYRLISPWDFPGKSIGVGCYCLLQYNSLGVFKENWIPACLTGRRLTVWSGGLSRWESSRQSSNPMKEVTFQSTHTCIYIHRLHHATCRISVPNQGLSADLWQWKLIVLTTGHQRIPCSKYFGVVESPIPWRGTRDLWSRQMESALRNI